MKKHDFFLRNYWQADASRGPLMIAELFSADIQGSESYCREILAAVQASESSADYLWQTAGNAYVVTVRQERTEITCQYTDEPAFVLPNSEMARLLTMWIGLFQELERARQAAGKRLTEYRSAPSNTCEE